MNKNKRDEQMPLDGTDEAEILARLSERVERAVAMIQELRKDRDTLRAKLADTEAKLAAMTSLEEETDRFRRERGEIRNRIESILTSLESLEESV
jgi:FtsZ-binding cell division protein ZapB